MDELADYYDRLSRDLIEQFKGKPNTEVLLRAAAKQLSHLHKFFSELNTLRYLQSAQGVQLDGIGDIVCLSRADALVISQLIGKNVPMDDETYRLYLAFKIHLNTSNCTHRDVYRALRMFWDKSPLYYSEDPAYPATMFFSTPPLPPGNDVSVLFLAPKIKAAGVALHILAITETPNDPCVIRVGGAVFTGISVTVLPMLSWDHKFRRDIHIVPRGESVTATRLPAASLGFSFEIEDGNLYLNTERGNPFEYDAQTGNLYHDGTYSFYYDGKSGNLYIDTDELQSGEMI